MTYRLRSRDAAEILYDLLRARPLQPGTTAARAAELRRRAHGALAEEIARWPDLAVAEAAEAAEVSLAACPWL